MYMPPYPTYEKDVQRLTSYYRKGFKEIVRLLKELNPNQVIEQRRYKALLQQISVILSQIDQKSAQWCQDVIQEAFEDAQARALASMGLVSTLAAARAQISTTEIVRNRAQQMIEDTMEDLLQATQNTDRKIKKIVREIVADSLRQNAIQNIGVRQNVKEVYDRLLKHGFSQSIREETFVGIVDRAGRRWDLETYAKMVVKTKIQQAQIEGARLEALENDSDLAIISSHGAKDACSYFEGMIISMNGLTKGYRTLADLRATNLIFHPNCQHTVHPIGDIDALPQSLIDKHEKASQTAEQALKNPKATKAQDYKKN